MGFTRSRKLLATISYYDFWQKFNFTRISIKLWYHNQKIPRKANWMRSRTWLVHVSKSAAESPWKILTKGNIKFYIVEEDKFDIKHTLAGKPRTTRVHRRSNQRPEHRTRGWRQKAIWSEHEQIWQWWQRSSWRWNLQVARLVQGKRT